MVSFAEGTNVRYNIISANESIRLVCDPIHSYRYFLMREEQLTL